MTFEEYKDREDFLEFAKIGTTFAHLEINNHELTHEEMEFFNDKVFLVPEFDEAMVLIDMAFKPYTQLFDYTIVETNIVRHANDVRYTAIKILVKY